MVTAEGALEMFPSAIYTNKTTHYGIVFENGTHRTMLNG